MQIISINDPQYRVIVKGSNDAAKMIYMSFFENLKDMGVLDVLNKGACQLNELCDELSIANKIRHRIQVALEGLCESGVVKFSNGKFSLLKKTLEWTDIDEESVSHTLSDKFVSDYLPLYRNGDIFNADFELQFNENFAAIWDGILNSAGNQVWRDLAVNWVSNPGASVIDLGFGTPNTLKQLSEIVGENGMVHGLDQSAHFVEVAKKSLQSLGNIGVIAQHDANEKFSFFEEKVDGLMFIGALHFVHNPTQLIQEISRVTNDGARVAIGTFFIDRLCFSGPAFQMHRNLFNPVPVLHDVNGLEKIMLKHGFETTIRTNWGGYTSLFCEKVPCSYSTET